MAENTETKLVKGAVNEDKQAGSNWSHAGSIMHSSKCMFVDTKGMTEKEAKAAQSGGYTTRIEQKCDAKAIPPTSKDKNSGDTIDTRDEDGNIRWGVVSFATKIMKLFIIKRYSYHFHLD